MNWREISDRELWKFCLQGNEDAWNEFVRRFQPPIARVVAGTLPLKLRRVQLIEELVQDTWKRFCLNNGRALQDLEWLHDKSLLGFVQKVAENVARDHIRRLKSQRRDIDKEITLDDSVKVPSKNNPESELNYKIFLEELERCLKRRVQQEADGQRAVYIFLLFRFQGFTAPDLSKVYRLSVKSVENTVAKVGRIANKHCL